MRAKASVIAAMGALLALSGMSAASARSPVASKQQCFWPQNVNGFAAADEHHVQFRVGVKDVYQAEMFGPCREVNWNTAIALVPRAGSGTICSGFDADIVSPTPIGPQRCMIRHIRKLTPAEVAALPKRGRP